MKYPITGLPPIDFPMNYMAFCHTHPAFQHKKIGGFRKIAKDYFSKV
ncbi:MAG: hypothetical protein KBS44_05710 [Clostridiales bacterium]|nr:hypothetical protein [Candidatus Coliplasma equi]